VTETPANSLYALADRLGLDDLAAPVVDAFHWMRGEARSRDFLLMSGVPGMLEALRGRFLLGIVSARDRRGVYAFLEQFDLAGYFGCVATARTCCRTKPHPAPVLWAAASLGIPAEACLMVGDTVVDIRSGQAAGAQTVGVLCGFGERDELKQAGADLIVETTADLTEGLPDKANTKPALAQSAGTRGTSARCPC
jgi:HAD superfamily hydrolase (TIGR01509 family)